MKKIAIILPLCAALGLVLAGCSKSKEAKPEPTGTNTPAGAPTAKDTAAAEPLDMKVKWTPGKRYQLRTEMSSDQDINIPGQPAQKAQTLLTEEFTVSALKANAEGGCDLQLQLTGAKLETLQDGAMATQFDSAQDTAQDGNNPLAALFRKLMAAKLVVQTDRAGKAVKLDGIAAVNQALNAAPPQVKSSFAANFSEVELKGLVDEGEFAPDHAVKLGESWPFQKDMNMPPTGHFKLDSQITFKGWEQHNGRRCALLSTSGDLSSVGPGSMAGMSMTLQSAKVTGESWFDPELGLITEGTGHNDLNVSLSAPKQTITVRVLQRTTAKVTELAP